MERGANRVVIGEFEIARAMSTLLVENQTDHEFGCWSISIRRRKQRRKAAHCMTCCANLKQMPPGEPESASVGIICFNQQKYKPVYPGFLLMLN